MLHDLHHERTMIGIFLQALRNEVVVVLSPIRRSVQSRWWIANDLEHRSGGMHISERRFTISQLDRCDSKRPNVGSVVVDFVIWNSESEIIEEFS